MTYSVGSPNVRVLSQAQKGQASDYKLTHRGLRGTLKKMQVKVYKVNRTSREREVYPR